MVALKPCPFCGGNARAKTDSCGVDGSGLFYQLHSVSCTKCGASTWKTFRSEFRRDSGEFNLLRDGYIEAVSDWNRRAET